MVFMTIDLAIWWISLHLEGHDKRWLAPMTLYNLPSLPWKNYAIPFFVECMWRWEERSSKASYLRSATLVHCTCNCSFVLTTLFLGNYEMFARILRTTKLVFRARHLAWYIPYIVLFCLSIFIACSWPDDLFGGAWCPLPKRSPTFSQRVDVTRPCPTGASRAASLVAATLALFPSYTCDDTLLRFRLALQVVGSAGNGRRLLGMYWVVLYILYVVYILFVYILCVYIRLYGCVFTIIVYRLQSILGYIFSLESFRWKMFSCRLFKV